MTFFSHYMSHFPWETVSQALYSSYKLPDDIPPEDNDFVQKAISLLSPQADDYLEERALEAKAITNERFGPVIQLYAPLYISNECTNSCLYCGFRHDNNIARKTLSLDEVSEEAALLKDMGFQHILLLTGEDKRAVSVDTLGAMSQHLSHDFSSITVEVYPMESEEYKSLIASGVDGLTVYQETYDSLTYEKVHPVGRKRDFQWRVDTPDRGGIAGFRKIGIGALLGLSDWRTDAFFTILHARYLARKYWKTHIQISFPRLRETPENYSIPRTVSDRDLVHMVTAARILLPDTGLVLSTRENAALRNNLIPLGVTSMSAGSKTEPGGYSHNDHKGEQFPVSDTRSPEEIAAHLKAHGYETVWKDWDREFLSRDKNNF